MTKLVAQEFFKNLSIFYKSARFLELIRLLYKFFYNEIPDEFSQVIQRIIIHDYYGT